MASWSANIMLGFLRRTLPESTDAALKETLRLEKLLEKPLTGSLEYEIEILLEKLRKVGASTNNESEK